MARDSPPAPERPHSAQHQPPGGGKGRGAEVRGGGRGGRGVGGGRGGVGGTAPFTSNTLSVHTLPHSISDVHFPYHTTRCLVYILTPTPYSITGI